jgi:hypothetical protein
MEVPIADQFFERTLFISLQLSVPLFLGTAFLRVNVQSFLHCEILVVQFYGGLVLLVDDICRSTSAVRLTKLYVIPPKTEMAVLVITYREGLFLLKPLYIKGRLVYASNGVSSLPAPGEYFGDIVACMKPDITVYVATNIEHVLIWDDDVDQKREWPK